MAHANLRLLAGALLILTVPSVASAQDSSPGEDIVASDIAGPQTRLVKEIQIPDTSPAVEVRLQIENPAELDLDLALYDSDPARGRPVPLCVGDSLEDDEICAVKRPEGGVLWAVVAAVARDGKTNFVLSRRLVDSSRADFVLAEPIAPNGIGVQVGPKKTSFQFRLESGELAAVVLDGEEREMSVTDEEGHVFRARRLGVGRQQASVGEKFATQAQKVEWLLQGVMDSKRYLVTVKDSGNFYRQANTFLSVIRPPSSVGFLIDFSAEDLDHEPNTIEGPGRKLSRPGTRRPILFKFLPDRSPLMAAEALPEDAYDIAICDEFGFALEIDVDRVLWNPRAENASKVRRTSDNLYFAVFPSPYAESTPKPPELTLLIKPPEVK